MLSLRSVFISLTVMVLGFFFLGPLHFTAKGENVAGPTTQAHPDLSADQVIKTVVEALQHNDAPQKDTGIKTAFAFASPGNKEMTGPLEHFIALVHSPVYEVMLNCKTIEYGPLHLKGETAEQAVKIIDQKGGLDIFIFTLSKQSGGAVDGCWMTDGVIRIPPAATQPAAPKRDPDEVPV